MTVLSSCLMMIGGNSMRAAITLYYYLLRTALSFVLSASLFDVASILLFVVSTPSNTEMLGISVTDMYQEYTTLMVQYQTLYSWSTSGEKIVR